MAAGFAGVEGAKRYPLRTGPQTEREGGDGARKSECIGKFSTGSKKNRLYD